jgi:hypothetical protein
MAVYGTVNADVIQSGTTGLSIGPGNATRFKNRIINGDMRIDQRNSGASLTITTANQYTLDRWQAFAIASSKYSVQQNAGSITPPVGFQNYLGVTSLAATTVGASDYYLLCQKIEGFNTADLAWGTANAQTVTLSFWVRSSLTGDFGGSLMNSAEDRSYPFSYTISSANTWTKISVTIAGDTTGTWLTTNGIGIKVWFSLGTGISFSGTSGAWTGLSSKYQPAGSTSVVSTNGATFYITGVQLEVASNATGFEYVDYTTQLAMCQRYCYKSSVGSFAVYSYFNVAICCDATTTAQGTMGFPVPMRSASSITLTTTGTASNYSLYSAGALRTLTVVPTLGAYQSSGESVQLALTAGGGGLTAGYSANLLATNASSAYLLFSSEL